MGSFGMSGQQVERVWVGFRAGGSLSRIGPGGGLGLINGVRVGGQVGTASGPTRPQDLPGPLLQREGRSSETLP